MRQAQQTLDSCSLKDADNVHQVMSAHNWLFLRKEDNFNTNLELLIDAPDTDLD